MAFCILPKENSLYQSLLWSRKAKRFCQKELGIGVTCKYDKRNFSLNSHLDEWSCDPFLLCHVPSRFVSLHFTSLHFTSLLPRNGCYRIWNTYPFPILANGSYVVMLRKTVLTCSLERLKERLQIHFGMNELKRNWFKVGAKGAF